jgi:hypothetical protein
MENDKCNDPNCACSHQSMDEILQWQADMLAKHGFYTHFTPNETDPNLCNIHTHGILENLLHPDFQIIILIPPKVAQSILWILVNMVKEGHRFNEGDIVNEIIHNYPVTFIKAQEGNRELLRVIFPDKKGNLSSDAIEGTFALQYYSEDGKFLGIEKSE